MNKVYDFIPDVDLVVMAHTQEEVEQIAGDYPFIRHVEWEWIGEGNCGDYNPDDPFDIPRLRFTVMVNRMGSIEPLEDGSYCTLATPWTPTHKLVQYSERILDIVSVNGGFRRELERLTWVDPVSIEDISEEEVSRDKTEIFFRVMRLAEFIEETIAAHTPQEATRITLEAELEFMRRLTDVRRFMTKDHVDRTLLSLGFDSHVAAEKAKRARDAH